MGPIMCPQCKDALEEDFKKVKAYIAEHNGCGIHEVAKECEVDINLIQQWLREERLQFSEGSQISLFCESCGQPIRSGRFCDKCKANMVNGFQQATRPATAPPPAKKEERESPRMRFLG